jgi:hypothetical protein
MRNLNISTDPAAGSARERATRRLAHLAVRSVMQRADRDGLGDEASPGRVAAKEDSSS